MSWFKFNGISSDDLGLIIRNPPFRPSWSENSELTEIPGRSAKVLELTGIYENQSLTIDCVVTDMKKIRTIYQILHGSGILVLSTATDEFLKVTVDPLIPQGVAQDMAELPISFSCSPFAYKVNDTEFTWTSEHVKENRYIGFNLSTDATVYCEPQVRIKFLKDVTLPLKFRIESNDINLYFTFTPPDGHYSDEIIVDCALKQIGYEDADGKLQPLKGVKILSGRFPILAARKFGETGYNADFGFWCWTDETLDGTFSSDVFMREEFFDYVKLKCNVRYL